MILRKKGAARRIAGVPLHSCFRSNIHRQRNPDIAAVPRMMHAAMTVVTDLAMRLVVNLANMGIPVIVTTIVANVSAMVVVMTHMTCRRAPVVIRMLLLDRRPVTNPSRRRRRRLAGTRRHAEQYRPENQSRHQIYPSFHVEHRLSFSDSMIKSED